MRYTVVFLLIVLANAGGGFAADPATLVQCSPLAYYETGMTNGEVGPFSAVTVVTGRLRSADLLVEHVHFGPRPSSETVRIVADHRGELPPGDDARPRVFILSAKRGKRGDRLVYGSDGFFVERLLPDATRGAHIGALAQLQFDYWVLGSPIVVVARRASAQPAAKPKDSMVETELVVERVLHGPVAVGDRLRAQGVDVEPIGSPAAGSFVYLLSDPNDNPYVYGGGPPDEPNDAAPPVWNVAACWSASLLDAVQAALQRRNDYPIADFVDPYGRPRRVLDVTFTGARSDAIAMLGSTSDAVLEMGMSRLRRDGAAALDELVAAVRRDLWQTPDGTPARFRGQMTAIRLLAELENGRVAGSRRVGLIDSILDRASSGAEYPGPPPDESDASLRQSIYGGLADDDANHSLAWLLETLPAADVAGLYGQRLMKLRDVAAYGWKDEAQAILELKDVADRLLLADLDARRGPARPERTWRAGFNGGGYFDRLAFSPDGRRLAMAGETVRVVNTDDGSIASEFGFDEVALPELHPYDIVFSPDGERLYLASGFANLIGCWDAKTGRFVKAITTDGTVQSLRPTPDGRSLLATTWGRKFPRVTRYDVAGGERVESFDGGEVLHADGRRYLSQQRDGWYVGALGDGAAAPLPFAAESVAWADDDLWTLERESPNWSAVATLLRRRRSGGDFAVLVERRLPFRATELRTSADGRMIVAANDWQAASLTAPDWTTVAAWQFSAQTSEFPNNGPFPAQSCELSPDGRLLAAKQPGGFPLVFDASTGKLVRLHAAHAFEIVDLRFSSDGRELITADSEGVECRWQAAAGRLLECRAASPAGPTTTEPIRDEILSFRDEQGRIWTIIAATSAAGANYETVLVPPFQVWRRDGDSAQSVGRRIDYGVKLGEIVPPWGQTRPLGLVPGGKFLHFGANVYARDNLKLVSSVNVTGMIVRTAFSADGSRYALVCGEFDAVFRPQLYREQTRTNWTRRIRVHDTLTGNLLFHARPDEPVHALALSPDGTTVAALLGDQTICLWQIDLP